MKALIEVKDRQERDAIQVAMQDPTVRAFVVVMGILQSLPTQRARVRVLTYVKDRFEEEAGDARTE